MEGRFLTRPLSIVLDFVRFGSAALVLLGHAVQLRIWAGPFPFGTRMQHYCVVVFFVLSGLVISTSVLGRRRTFAQFAIARFARIVPVAVPAVLFSTVAAYVLAGPHRVLIDNTPDSPLAMFRQVLGAFMFLSGRPEVAGPAWNPPYWSLCYEVWFYILFGIGWYLRGWERWVLLVVSALFAGPTILMLAPVWLTGAVLTHWRPARGVPLWLAPWLMGLAIWAAIRVMGVDHPWKVMLRQHVALNLSWSEWVLSDLAMGAVMAVAFAALRPLADWAAPVVMRLERPARTLAGFSFTLYLFHWPVLELIQSWGLGHLRDPLAFAGVLVGIMVLCWVIAQATEGASPAFRRMLERYAVRWSNGRLAAVS